MDAHVKKLINARAKMIESFKYDADVKRQCLFEYTLALNEAGLMTWSELVTFNAKPRFSDGVA